MPFKPTYNPRSGVTSTPVSEEDWYASLKNDTDVAAESNLNQKSQNAAFRDPAVRSGTGSVRSGNVNPNTTYTPARQAANSSNAKMPWMGSNEWFGNLDEYGAINAANSPSLMFDLYATQNLGLRPGSATAGFLSDTYNPYKMAQAFGQDLTRPDQALAAGTWLANQIGKPGATFFDPAQMVSSALKAIAAGPSKNNDWGELANIIAPPGSQPGDQLQNLMNFLSEALKGAMTDEALGAYLAWLNQKGMEVVNRVMTSNARGGGLAEFERNGGNIASALLSIVGNRGGL